MVCTRDDAELAERMTAFVDDFLTQIASCHRKPQAIARPMIDLIRKYRASGETELAAGLVLLMSMRGHGCLSEGVTALFMIAKAMSDPESTP
jgi:hypothetical protein